MAKREGKSLVIFMSSFADSVQMPYNSFYGASKAFIWSLSKSLRAEMAPKVDVSVLRPLYVDTRLASFLPSNDPMLISPEKFVTSSIRDIEKKKFVSYGHWKHVMVATLSKKSPIVSKMIDKYLLICNKRAEQFVCAKVKKFNN